MLDLDILAGSSMDDGVWYGIKVSRFPFEALVAATTAEADSLHSMVSSNVIDQSQVSTSTAIARSYAADDMTLHMSCPRATSMSPQRP